MKRSQAFPSRFIGKDDVLTPLVATIADVAQEDVQDEGRNVKKTVMTFREAAVKPLMLNGCNWQTCEDAHGEDSDDWRGKSVEIYVDPNVMFGRDKVGGVRVRIPVVRPALPPTRPGLNGTKKVMTIDQKHAYVLAAYAEAQDDDKVLTIATWATGQRFSPHQEEEQTGSRFGATERISMAQAPTNSDENIPF